MGSVLDRKEAMETECTDRSNIRCDRDFLRKKFKEIGIDITCQVWSGICWCSIEASEIVTIR